MGSCCSVQSGSIIAYKNETLANDRRAVIASVAPTTSNYLFYVREERESIGDMHRYRMREEDLISIEFLYGDIHCLSS